MIEELRYLLKGDPGLYLAQVAQVSELDSDKSEYLAKLKILPDRGEFVAPQAMGDEKLQAGDIVLLAIPADEPEYAYIVFVLPNTSNTLHPRTNLGHRVLKSRAGKKLHLVSDTKVTIGKGLTTEEAEPLVLGAVLTSCLTDLVTNIGTLITHSTTIAAQLSALASVVGALPGGAGAAAVVTAMATLTAPAPAPGSLPTLKVKIDTTDKDKYLVAASTNIKSQLAFTERGGS